MAVDAWVLADPTLCDICGQESCEEHFSLDALPAPDHAAERAASITEARVRRIGDAVERLRVQREAERLFAAEERDALEPELVTLEQLLKEPEPAVTWRIEGWQPNDTRVILAAPRKSGKTTLVGALARALVDGDPWLGEARVTPLVGTVAILDTEMSRSQLRRWLRAQQIQHTDRVVIAPLRGRAATLDLADADCRLRWQAWLRARHVQYVIVDCLRPVLDALGLDESREAGGWLVGLDALLRDAGIPDCCVVHHMGHAGERSRGDSRLRDWPDTEWRVVRQNEDDTSPRFIAAFGRDVEIPEGQLAYDAVTRRLTMVGGSRRQVRAARALDAVIAALRAAGEALTGRGIKDALTDGDHGREAIETALQMGVREGQLTVERGARNARLYRVSQNARVSHQCPADTRPERVSECPNPPLRGGHSGHSATLPLSGSDREGSKRSKPDTHTKRRPRPAGDGTRNTPRTRRQAAGK